MARINLEDQFWLDIMEVAVAMGSADLAIGNAVRFFRFAQEMHRQGKLVSEADFKSKGFHDTLIPIFAMHTPEGISAKGSEKYFGWLTKKAAAGAVGGRSKTEAKTKHLKQNRSTAEAKASKTEASYSPSYSSSPSNSHSTSTVTNASDYIAAYCDRFKLRWGINPPIQGKDAGIVGRLMKTVKLDKFRFYLDAYFTMPDAGVVKAKHPLNLLELKLNEVMVWGESGEFTTMRQAYQADESVSNALLMRKIDEGKI